MWVLTFYATFVRNISHSKKNSAKICVITNVLKSSSKGFVSLFKCEFSQCTFEKKSKNIDFNTIEPEKAGLFHADRETDRRTDINDEANFRFSQFCENA
jgi:hypothetical protein